MQDEKRFKPYGRIVFPGRKNNVIENPHDIAYCKADDHYIDIYFKDEKRMNQAVCLKYIESRLDPDVFLRCHKSYIINMEYVKSYWYYEKYIIVKLCDANQIPVSIDYVNAFGDMLQYFPTITRI